MPVPNTWDRIDSIEDNMKAVIQAASDADVFDVKLKIIHIGPKVKTSKFQPPLIWILANPSPIDDTSFALNETWTLKYIIVGVIKDHDPEVGMKAARRLALQASAELIKDSDARQLGGTTHDIVRTGWIPAENTAENDDTIFGAGIEFDLKFKTKQP